MNNLTYERYVKKRNKQVEELSNGRLGYVHVRGMNDASFRQVYSDALGKHADKEALIVDTRFNGGGWLHDDLATFLGGKMYAISATRTKDRARAFIKNGTDLQRLCIGEEIIQMHMVFLCLQIFRDW